MRALVTVASCILAAMGLIGCDGAPSRSGHPFYKDKYHHERARVPLAPPYEVRYEDEGAVIVKWEGNAADFIQQKVREYETSLPYVYGQLSEMIAAGHQSGKQPEPGGLWFIFDTRTGTVQQLPTEESMVSALRDNGAEVRPLRPAFDHFREFHRTGWLHWFPVDAEPSGEKQKR